MKNLDKVNFKVKTGNLLCYIVTVSCKSDILSLTSFNNIRYSKAINTPSLPKLILGLVRKRSNKRLHLMVVHYWLHIQIRKRGHWLLLCKDCKMLFKTDDIVVVVFVEMFMFMLTFVHKCSEANTYCWWKYWRLWCTIFWLHNT